MIINTKKGNMYTVQIKEVSRLQQAVKWYDFTTSKNFKSPIHKEGNVEYCIIRGQNIPLSII